MTVEEIKLHLIDLHRAQIRIQTPKRWVIKDLAGLCFSSIELASMELTSVGTKITDRDYFRFIKSYTGSSLRIALEQKPDFWQTVYRRACRLYKKQHQKRHEIA